MEIRRFFATKEHYNGDYINLQDDELWHLSKVLRLKIGFEVVVALNDGFDYYGVIESINKNEALIKVNKIVKNDVETKKEITLCQALPKKDKLEFTVQKAVELGISKFIIFNSEYSQKYDINIERLKTIVKDASKQCGRAKLMAIILKDNFYSFADMLNDYSYTCFFYENERHNNLKNVSKQINKSFNLAIVVGSEGGFSEGELDYIKTKIDNVAVLSLGKRILRTETACVVATSLVLAEAGELD